MSEGLRIVKLSGAGNDFIAIGPREIERLGSEIVPWVRRVCRRGLSVGADGVLLVEPHGAGRVRVRFHNPDGSPAFCGNGTRCAARFAQLAGFAGQAMVLDTRVGPVPAEILPTGVRLELPPPQDRGNVSVEGVGDRTLAGRSVLAGVPHFVLFVEDLRSAPLEQWGPKLRRHARFGEQGTNVDLVESRSDDSLALRTWERGVENETLSCGTGAVASAYAAWCNGGPPQARVLPAGGVPLTVRFTGRPEAPEQTLFEGDARVVFEGTVRPEATRGFPP